MNSIITKLDLQVVKSDATVENFRCF